jgi:putative Mg2+ transporter-C (MgtC) family protein
MFYDLSMTLAYTDVIVRLGAAVIAGALIGIDREIRNKPAGLRTITLVSLGSAVFVLTAIEGGMADSTSRVVQGIVTGIGFLGAGTIIHGPTEESVRGLTTAASVWLAAAIGIACGLAYWPLVLVGSAFGLLVLALEGVEERFKARLK